MWIFTTDGFFSVVQDRYCKDDELVIRARCKKDLQSFCKKTGIKKPEILEFNQADYRFRIIVKKEVWVYYIKNFSENIDYSNFKNQLNPKDHKRHDAYFSCWSAMYNFQKAQ